MAQNTVYRREGWIKMKARSKVFMENYHKGAIPLLPEEHFKHKEIPTRSLLPKRDLFPYQFQLRKDQTAQVEEEWDERHLKKEKYETIDPNRTNKWL